ncbi:MAG: PepSY domain-containing protein [Rhodoferax sp.]|uniref:PepSY domain-containing protein n=1 Tax=Rhodoferax sp. TaxID=50421 RepID=UPI001400A7CD|nr:PepSY domain-containing protein [Rhodoferax sp.]NDP39655.1 PepSY domain-containing protein [Rhodoferax sp.]
MQHAESICHQQRLPLPSHFWRLWGVVLWACVLMGYSAGAWADSDHDHDRAREALQSGEVLPLATILERVEREHAGKVLDVELDRDKDHGVVRWVYKIKVLTTGGTRLKLQIDAKTGDLIRRKRKD